MNRLTYFLALIVCCNGSSYCQNLVTNPGLENYSSCPDNDSQIDRAVGWFPFRDSPDYYNSCSTNPDYLTPQNYIDYQWPISGSSYGGIITSLSGIYDGNIGPGTKELAGGSLSQSLTIGTKYFVSFRTNLGVNYLNSCNCASNNLGISFSVAFHDISNPFPINNLSMINESAVIVDTLNWTKVFGSFVADSAYQYIVLGNFYDDNNTDTLILDTSSVCKFAYYFFDDVCVSTDSAFAYNYIGIEDFFSNGIQVFPNPCVNSVFIKFIYPQSTQFEIWVSNVFGQILINSSPIFLESSSSYEINLSNLSSGTYYLHLKHEKKSITQKIIKL
jgi:hypothetical protein